MLTNISSEISGKSCDQLSSKYVVEAWTNMSRSNIAEKCWVYTAGAVTAVDLHYDRGVHPHVDACRHCGVSCCF
jgi:hypothetical protein